MQIDSFYLVSKDERIMILPVLEFPSISGLVLVRAENLGQSKLDSVLDSGRMNDHEVDLIACAGGRNEAEVCGAVIKGDGGAESALRNTDNFHAVVGLDHAAYCTLVVEITGDLVLKSVVGGLADEQDSAFSRYFSISHDLLGCCDQIGNIGCANSNVSVYFCACVGCINSKTISIDLRNDLSSHELTNESSESHAEGLFVIHAVNDEVYATVFCQLKGLPSGSQVSMGIACGTVIVSEARNGCLEQLYCVGTDPLNLTIRSIKAGSESFSLIHFIEYREKFLSKCD